jgi:hypothetical protein
MKDIIIEFCRFLLKLVCNPYDVDKALEQV